MASIFYLIFIMMLSYALAAQNFVPVSVCPRDKYTWDLESVKKKCQGDTPNYLCAAIENQVGKYGEICTKFGLSPASKYNYSFHSTVFKRHIHVPYCILTVFLGKIVLC